MGGEAVGDEGWGLSMGDVVVGETFAVFLQFALLNLYSWGYFFISLKMYYDLDF